MSDSFDRYLDNKICLKTKDRKQKKQIVTIPSDGNYTRFRRIPTGNIPVA
jgi:hypothetical protein